jgi:hypothetical protein
MNNILTFPVREYVYSLLERSTTVRGFDNLTLFSSLKQYHLTQNFVEGKCLLSMFLYQGLFGGLNAALLKIN